VSLEADIAETLGVPLLRFLGVRFAEQGPGYARLLLNVRSESLNANNSLHAGVLYTLLDVVAYVALMPLFEPGETAVTHNMNASLMRPVAAGTEVELKGHVLRRGRTLVFVQAEAFSEGKQVACATVCKSIVAAPDA